MALNLPEPAGRYFSAGTRFDLDGMLAPFAADAVVRDERRTHAGTAAIRAWIAQASLANRAIATPLALRSEGDRHLVTAQVAGAFPGSPVTLTFAFRLDGTLIRELEIG